MSGVIERIPSMSIDDINTLRKNAKERLDNPKYSAYAREVLAAIGQELDRRYLPGMIATFKKRYPGGFYGDIQAEEERNYKVNACDRFQELLRKEEFLRLLTSKQYDELYRRAVRTNIGIQSMVEA